MCHTWALTVVCQYPNMVLSCLLWATVGFGVVIVLAASSKDKSHRLDEFTVSMKCFDDVTFYMNPHITENSIRVFNEFIYSVFISYNK